jgi:DNA modification methylase
VARAGGDLRGFLGEPVMQEPVRIGDATLYLGDCRELISGLPRVDAVITDPPYGLNLGKHGAASDGRSSHVLVKEGYASYEDTLENFSRVVVPAVIQALEIAERGFVFCSGKASWYLPPPDAIGGVYIPSASGRCSWGFNSMAHAFLYGKAPDLNKGSKPTAIRSNETSEQNGHPCPKPLGWMEWAVDLGSRKGEIVLDPFMGSGTTGVACVLHGRRFVGIEVDPGYFDIACRRIEQAYAQRPLFSAEPQRKPEQLGLEAA